MRHGKLVHYIVAAALLASLVPLQRNIDARREREKLGVEGHTTVRPGEAAIGLLLAGFRGLAANMLWFRVWVLYEQGRVTEEIPLFQAISYLQPRFRAMWSFAAWHMAYNVSAHFLDREDLSDAEVDDRRYRSFEIGEAFLRKGIKHNYYHYDLHWDLGFSILYYKKYKLLKEKGWRGDDEALQAAVREMRIASLFQPPLAEHPAYVDRIIAIVMAEGGMLDEAYKIWHRLERMSIDETKSHALDMEKKKKLADAFKTWYHLQTEAEVKQAQLAKAKPPDPDLVNRMEKDLESFSENVRRLRNALARQGADLKALEKTALDPWRQHHQNMKLVMKHMSRLVRNIKVQDTQSYALDLDRDGNLAEAYKIWYNLLQAAKDRKAEFAQDTWSDPADIRQTDKDIESFTENVERLEEALKKDAVDVQSLQNAALQEGTPPALQERIGRHLQSLEEQAGKDHADDKAETMRMYRDLTRPAPRLDWWVLLFVPLLLLAAGYLIFGKEVYAS